MILKKGFSIIINLCGITSIILLICFFIGNIVQGKIGKEDFIPIGFILISLSLNHNKNKNHKEYKKYDGIKKVFTGLIFFYIIILVIMIFGQWFH